MFIKDMTTTVNETYFGKSKELELIEKSFDKANTYFKDRDFTANFKKENGKYKLDRIAIIFLIADFSYRSYRIRYKMIELIQLLYINELEKGNKTN